MIGARRRPAHGHDAATRRAPSTSCATTAWSSRTARCRACCRSPGSAEHAIGFKSLADAIWLRNHVIQCLEMADATDDPGDREELLTFVVVGGGYAGLEALAELQDFAAEAIEQYPRARLHGMRWMLVEAMDRVLPEIDPSLADYALRELRSRGIDIRLGTTLEEVTATSARLSTGEMLADAHRRVDGRRDRLIPSSPQPRPAARRARAHRRRRLPAGAGRGRRLGARRRRRRPRPAQARPSSARRPPSTRSARAGRRAATSPRRSASGEPAPFSYKSLGQFVNLGRYKAVAKVGRSSSAASPPGGWRARTTSARSRAPRARCARSWTGPSACRSSATSPRSARSASRARCARTCTSARARTAA